MLSELYQEAMKYTTEGDFVVALPAWEKHYQMLTPDTDVIEQYFVHYYLADALGENGQVKRAIKLLEEALKILPAEEDGLLLSTLVEICRFLMIQEKFAEADKIRDGFWSELLLKNRIYEAYYTALDKYAQNPKEGDDLLNEVLRLAVETKHIDFLFHYYRDHAAHLLSQKRFNELIDLSQIVRKLLRENQTSEAFQTTVIFTCLNELEVYYQKQEYKLLKTRLIEFRSILDVSPPEEKRIITLRLFYEGINTLIDANVNLSLEFFSRAEVNAQFDEEFHLLTLEKIYQALADFYYYDEALLIAKRAMDLAANSPDEYSLLDISVDIAQIQDNANYFNQSIETLRPIESRVIIHGDDELIQRFYSLLTKAAEQLPDAELFEYARQQWYEVGKRLPDDLAFDFYFDYAQTLINLNQVEQAITLYERAERIAKTQGWDHHLPHIIVEKAICDAKLNRYQSCYLRLQSMLPPKDTIHLYATYLNLSGDCQHNLGMQNEAIGSYKKTINLISQHPYFFHYASSSYSNLGLIEHANKNYSRAEVLYLKGLEIDIRSGIVQQEITALYNLGILNIDWNRHNKAESYLWAALGKITNAFGKNNIPAEQKYISDEWFTIIELLVEVLVVRGDEWAALRLLLNKHVSLSGLNKNNINQLPLPHLNSDHHILAYSGIRQERIFIFQLYFDKWSRSQHLKTTKVDLNEATQTAFSTEVLNAVERFRKRTLTKPGERDKNYQSPYPWMIRYARFLAAQPDRFLTPQKVAIRNELFTKLAKVLLPPIFNLSSIKQLTISPNYILGTLPFCALYVNATNKRRLVEDFELSVFGGIAPLKDNLKSNHNALIFGATEYANTTDLTDLPASIDEINIITTLFPRNVNLVDNPSQNIIEKLNKIISKTPPTYLHYIGHAESRYPESVLYYPYASGGIIAVSELQDLNLSGVTVYISACSGADGSAYAGWGIDSVARAFISSGASNIISMLFPLSDQLSPLLVEQFYQQLQLGKTPMAALTKVQRSCIMGEFGIPYQSIQCWGSLLCIERFIAQ